MACYALACRGVPRNGEYTGRTEAVESVDVRLEAITAGSAGSRSGYRARQWLHRPNQFQGRATGQAG
jgi:hypothetical protein